MKKIFASLKLNHSARLTIVLFLSALVCSSASNAEPGILSRVFGLRMNTVAEKVATLPNPDSSIYPLQLEFSPDGTRLAVESYSEKIRNDANVSARIYIWDWGHQRIATSVEMPTGFGTQLAKNCLSYSPDGRFLAVCDPNGAANLRIWNTATWAVARDIGDDVGICTGIAFLPDSKALFIISSGSDLTGTLVRLSTVDWSIVWSLDFPNFDPRAIAISPRGDIAATLGWFFLPPPDDVVDPLERNIQTKRIGALKMVNINERKLSQSIEGGALGQGVIRGPIVWAPDGHRLSIASSESVTFLETATGKFLSQIQPKSIADRNLRYTADGRYLIESDSNGRGTGIGVMIWDSEHRELLQKISGDIGSMAISRDGKYLATGTSGKATVWKLN